MQTLLIVRGEPSTYSTGARYINGSDVTLTRLAIINDALSDGSIIHAQLSEHRVVAVSSGSFREQRYSAKG